MVLPVSLFLALKYLKPKRTFLSVVTVISILGIVLGVAVLVIVLSVMNGFDDMWRDKILGFNAHITVSRYGEVELEGVPERIMDQEGVIGVGPYVEGLMILQFHDRVFTPIIRGVDPDLEHTVSKVPSHIVEGAFSIDDDQIVVGEQLAGRLSLRIGSKVLIFSPYKFKDQDEITVPEELTVSGIFHVGMYDFDLHYAFTSLDTARYLLDVEEGMVHGIQVVTADPFKAASIARSIEEGIGSGLRARTWMELNNTLFDALKVEKNMMFFLLIIISFVASFSITNTLITVAVQKTREIGLLKAVGFSSGSVMGIFLWQGWIQGVLGVVLGNGLGLYALAKRNELLRWMSGKLNMELLPESIYLLSSIPATISTSDLLIVALLTMAFCTVAGVVPAYRAVRLDPVKALRYE